MIILVKRYICYIKRINHQVIQEINKIENSNFIRVFKVWDEWTTGTPNGKPQDPIDIANMVAFLCSEEARYITSQNIGVDGGYTF